MYALSIDVFYWCAEAWQLFILEVVIPEAQEIRGPTNHQELTRDRQTSAVNHVLYVSALKAQPPLTRQGDAQCSECDFELCELG
eukprot:3538333-Amphidinium_carterae.1